MLGGRLRAAVAHPAPRALATLRSFSIRSPTEGLFVAVKIRLARHGSNKNPIYRVVVADSRVPRDGRTLEEIGRYNPQMQPSLVEIDADRAREWIARGAQPTDTVRKLLKIAGV